MSHRIKERESLSHFWVRHLTRSRLVGKGFVDRSMYGVQRKKTLNVLLKNAFKSLGFFRHSYSYQIGQL